MKTSIIALFAVSVACDVSGQLAFKLGANRLPAARAVGAGLFALSLVSEPWLLAGLAIYALEFLVWTRILALVPLAIAFPLASLNILGITLASHLWLNERIGRRQYAGAVLVTAGVALVATSL
ncbi:EamA family transporter [Roseixanthobacter pseudopolyaromaticivorans]|uniref:EamA family transporter n=1 Tax=Xanthobacteraceae TaxID=335928 RepID=UPI00372BF624